MRYMSAATSSGLCPPFPARISPMASFFFLMLRRPPRSPLFPSTPLFRSGGVEALTPPLAAEPEPDVIAAGGVGRETCGDAEPQRPAFHRRVQRAVPEHQHSLGGRLAEIGRAHV